MFIKMMREPLFWQIHSWWLNRMSAVTILVFQAETSFSEEEEEKLRIAFSLEKQDLHLVLEAISFIFGTGTLTVEKLEKHVLGLTF
uniref:Uncharacterized protein n=1 Tax=Meleagris gallopavo TaxID=9103 RepID=A0A803YRU5_MELGA